MIATASFSFICDWLQALPLYVYVRLQDSSTNGCPSPNGDMDTKTQIDKRGRESGRGGRSDVSTAVFKVDKKIESRFRFQLA